MILYVIFSSKSYDDLHICLDKQKVKLVHQNHASLVLAGARAILVPGGLRDLRINLVPVGNTSRD